MAAKVTITKKTEAALREALPTLVLGLPLATAVQDILTRVDSVVSAPSKSPSGLSSKRLLEILRPYRSIQEPGDVPWAQGMWARAQRTINRLGVTEEHATTLGKWIAGQTTWKTPITLDMLTKNLESWLSKAHGFGTPARQGPQRSSQFPVKWEAD